MKTPKRDYKVPYSVQRQDIIDCTLESWKSLKETRWKRKNKITQYKRTISRILAGENLVPELQTAYRFMRLVMSLERKNEDELRFVQCLQMLAKHFSMLAVRHMDSVLNKQRKNAHKQAENGQQAELPPAGGQQGCNAQNAENATQVNLLCTDEAHLTERKEQA